MITTTAFDRPDVREKFLEHYNTIRGRVRSEIVRRHLLSAVPGLSDGGRKVLDVGCGDGRDSIWLAQMGHRIFGYDSANAMVLKAQAAADQAGIDPKAFAHGTEVTAAEVHGTGSFDLVLSHGVIMYRDDPDEFVRRHVELTSDDGWLSLIAKNFDGLPHRAAQEQSYRAALESLDDSNGGGHLGVETQAQTVQQIATFAAVAGGTITSWAGVRMFVDTIKDSSEILDEDGAIELEWKACRLDPHRGVAALIHLVILHGIDLTGLPA